VGWRSSTYIDGMTALAETSLSADERGLVERFVEEIRSFFIAEVDRDKVVLGGQG
jgi:hypothetical protein